MSSNPKSEAVDKVNLNRANKREITKIEQSDFSRQKCSLEKIEPQVRSNLAWGVWGRRKAPVGGLGGKTPKHFRLSPGFSSWTQRKKLS